MNIKILLPVRREIQLFKRENKAVEDHDYEKIIFEKFYHRVYRAAYYVVKDHHLAHDVVQETFIKAFKKIHVLKDESKLGAWLGTIATRTAIDLLRKENKRNDVQVNDVYIDESINNDQETSVEVEVEDKVLLELVKRNIKKLEPPEYREIIILRYVYDLNYKEIANALKLSLSATKSRLHRATQKLKMKLSKHNESEGDDPE